MPTLRKQEQAPVRRPKDRRVRAMKAEQDVARLVAIGDEAPLQDLLAGRAKRMLPGERATGIHHNRGNRALRPLVEEADRIIALGNEIPLAELAAWNKRRKQRRAG